MKKNSVPHKFLVWSDNIIFIIVMVIISGALTFFSPTAGIISFISIMFLIYYNRILIRTKNSEMADYIERINSDFDEITKTAVFSMPFPLLVIDKQGKIRWYNTDFKKIVSGNGSLLNLDILNILPNLNMKGVTDKSNKSIDMEIQGSYYRFYINHFSNEKSNNDEVVLLYGVDRSELVYLTNKYNEDALNIAIVSLDNYDEVRGSLEENIRPLLFAEIDRKIISYAKAYDAYARKYDQDYYLIITSKKSMDRMIENKFSLLDTVRETRMGNTIPVTLSIGVSGDKKNPIESYNIARSSLDVALGRGGDQAVVNIDNELKYFGGKNKAQEKRNKVKARVIAHALLQLISQSNGVFIMGHKNPDMDSIGACLGIYEACKLQDKKANIVLNEVSPAIENIYNRLKNDEYFDQISFIDSEEAMFKCDSDSLVIVLDNHRKNSTECPDLLDITKKVVLIDHHRRGSDYIKDPVITYLEPYASSTSEMVTELLYYMSEKLELPKIIAEALLAGITVDTKNFYYQTGVRTFEAASLLKRQGADSIEVKQLFRDDADTMRIKSRVVADSVIYKDNIAIGILENEVDESILIAAQAADDLLNILGVSASFVLAKIKDKVHISGRSLGKISVQLILEKIGGGGHLTSAGTQLEKNIEESLSMLKEAIDKYYEEDTNETYID